MGRDLSSWRSRESLPGLAVAAVAGVVFLLEGFAGTLARDQAIFVYAGQRVADGALPYVEMTNRSGPLSHVVPGIGIVLGRFLGLDDVFAARLTFWLVSVITVFVAFRLARTLLGSTSLATATALTFVMITGFVEYATQGPRDKALMLLFLVLALDSILRRHWLRAGLHISLATLTWQPVFFPAIVTALVVLALTRERRWRGLLRLAAGGLAPLALFVVVYAAIGRLQLFLDSFVLIHLRYTEQPGFFDNPARAWSDLVRMYGISLWVMLVGMLAALVVGGASLGRLLRRRRAATSEEAFVIAVGAGTLVTLAWTARAHNAWPDLFFAYPYAVLGVGLVLRALTARITAGLSRRRPRAHSWVPVAVATTWSLAAILIGAHYAVTHRSHELDRQRAVATEVVASIGPDVTVRSIQAPAPLVLTGRTNPVPDQMLEQGLRDYIEDVRPGGLDGFFDRIISERPTLLVLQSERMYGKLRAFLRDNYVELGTDGPGRYTYYVRDDLDPASIERARLAVDG